MFFIIKQDNTGLLSSDFVTDSSLLKLILNYIFVEFNKNSYMKLSTHVQNIQNQFC